MPISDYGLDKFVGTDLSKLTDCNAPVLHHFVQGSEHWIANFVLNSMFHRKIAEPQSQHIFRYLMASQRALAEFENGRLGIHSYLDLDNEKKISSYLKSVQHFESCIEQADLAMRLLIECSGERRDVFIKDDNSPPHRLRKIYNCVKHEDLRFRGRKGSQVGNLPLWIGNTGIHSNPSDISFAELAELLEMLSRLAERFSNPEP